MLDENDKIAIGLSGGKDSVVLLHLMKRIEEKFPKSSLLAITIDEGISDYRERSIETAKKNALSLGVSHSVFAFKDVFGYSIDEIMSNEHVKKLGFSACAFCGSLRRRALNQKARELGATKLAVGHNLDDEAQSVLMNVFRSDISRLARLSQDTIAKTDSFVPRIKPLRSIPERETILYAHYKGIEFHSQPCPYSFNVLRGEIESILNGLEHKRPGTKYGVLRFLDDLTPFLKQHYTDTDFTRCEQCGELSSGKMCNVCKLMSELNRN